MVLLDVNSTMFKQLGSSSSSSSNLGEQRIKVARDAIRMLLEQKLLHNPKHDVSLVLFGTPDTNNRMHEMYGDANHYSNISVVRTLQNVDLDFFRQVQGIQATPMNQEPQRGDMVDALIVGLDELIRFCGTRKVRKRIFLITDGEKRADLDKAELSKLIENIKSNQVKLNCITMDFCNELAEDSDEEDEEDDQVDLDQQQIKEKK